MDIKKFVKMCRMSQKELKKYVAKKLESTHENVVTEDGFVFAPGTFPVLLVAHLDTVHANAIRKIHYDKSKGALSSPQGIGGDDRCGVYMILEIVKKYNCSVLFCEDEEIGGAGADKFIDSDFVYDFSANYIVELDRKGFTDAVFYNCDNPEFEKFICQEHFKTNWGTFSDISTIAPFLGVAAVNLSSGYYNAHTPNEYVVMREVDANIKHVCDILERTPDTVFKYIPVKWNYSYSRAIVSADSYSKDDAYWIVEYEDTDGTTKWTYVQGEDEDMALFDFLCKKQNIPYANIISIIPEDDDSYYYHGGME